MTLVIDAHTHVLPADWVTPDPTGNQPGRYRVEVRGPGRVGVIKLGHGDAAGFDLAKLIDLERRLDDMAIQGIDRQVLSVPPPFGFVYALEPSLAVLVCREFNDALARLRAHPSGAFLALATLPLQDPEAAVRELDRATSELGLDGVSIGSHAGPMELDDPALDPLYGRLEALGVPLFIHSTRALAPDRLNRYHLGNVIGNPTEDSIAAARLIFGGVLDDHPGLHVYLAHGGGSYPLLHGRWSRGWSVRPEARQRLRKPPSAYRSRIVVDSLTHDVDALRYVVRTVGVGQVVLGSDYPYDMADPDPVSRVRALTELGPEDQGRILGATAGRLFGLTST